jgi:aspartokinase/homoserine dehydrogenase 1
MVCNEWELFSCLQPWSSLSPVHKFRNSADRQLSHVFSSAKEMLKHSFRSRIAPVWPIDCTPRPVSLACITAHGAAHWPDVERRFDSMSGKFHRSTAHRFDIEIPILDARTYDLVGQRRPSGPSDPLVPAKKPLQVMKFGGTSVGDALCISRVAEIVVTASRERSLVIVVSAISGVTDRFLEAAAGAASGDSDGVSAIMDALRKQHYSVVHALLGSTAARELISRQFAELFREADRLFDNVILSQELTLSARDSISSLGERLSARLVAAVLADRGLAICVVDATSLIVTNSEHGSADPIMDSTRECCEAQLRPLLNKSVVPVVTGFIGATAEGALTTLGRGGSDYSATILGAALDANEVIIWTDVDGVLTADPRLVPEARRIPEISYREAALLARFGAKVLHPKTLQPVMQSDIPVWIRNSFAPEQLGTKITPAGLSSTGEVKAVTAINDAQLIAVSGPRCGKVRDAVGRALTATKAVSTDAWLITRPAAKTAICIAVCPTRAQQTVEALRKEFATELNQGKLERIVCESSVAILTLVGQKLTKLPEIRTRASTALGHARIDVVGIAEESSECNLSLAVAHRDVKMALAAMHREFQLGTLFSQAVPPKPFEFPSPTA